MCSKTLSQKNTSNDKSDDRTFTSPQTGIPVHKDKNAQMNFRSPIFVIAKFWEVLYIRSGN